MAGYLALVAEATNAISGVLIISCLLLVTLLILRFQHGEHSSVVRVQHQPVQVAVQKLFVPYTLQLCTRSQGALSCTEKFLNVRVRCGASGRGCLVRWWWGVQRGALASLLHVHWQQFKTSVIEDLAFPDAKGQSELLEEGEHELELRSSEALRLGPLPRERYPLVVVQLDTERQHCDSQLGSVVTVLHVRDADCPDPSRVLYQYLKQCTGQLTMLTTLYTQSNGVNSTVPSTSQGSEEDAKQNSVTIRPAESTAPAREYAEVGACESSRNRTDSSEAAPPQTVFATDDLEVEAVSGSEGEAHLNLKSKFNYKSRKAESDDDTGDCKQTKNTSDLGELNADPSGCNRSGFEGTRDQTAGCGLYSSDIVDVCLKKRPIQVSDNGNVASSSSHRIPTFDLPSSPRKELDKSKRSEPSGISSVEEIASAMSHTPRPSNEPRACSTSCATVGGPQQSCLVLTHGQTLGPNVNLSLVVKTDSNLDEIVRAATTQACDSAAAAQVESPSGAAAPLSDVAAERCVLTSDAAAEPSLDAAAEPPLDAVAAPPSDAAAEPPSDAAAEPPSDAAAEPPSDAAAEPPSDAAAEPPSDAAAEPPFDAAAEPPSDAAAEPPSDECVVCQVERVAVALLPCCHVCVCFPCFQHLMAQRQTCPLCRQHVSAYFVV